MKRAAGCTLQFLITLSGQYNLVLLKETSRSKFQIGLRPQTDIVLWVHFFVVYIYLIFLNTTGQIFALAELGWIECISIMGPVGVNLKCNVVSDVGNPCFIMQQFWNPRYPHTSFLIYNAS
jgi:hypothetical protein